MIVAGLIIILIIKGKGGKSSITILIQFAAKFQNFIEQKQSGTNK